jgi:hypothetical protein
MLSPNKFTAKIASASVNFTHTSLFLVVKISNAFANIRALTMVPTDKESA